MAEMKEKGFPVYGANGRIGYTDKFTHERPTILIGCRGSCGTVHITEPQSYANGNAMALDALNESQVDIRFLARFLEHRGFRDVTTGTSQPQIIRENLIRVQVPVPPLPEQRRIAEILDKAGALQAKRRAALAKLDTLSQSIFLDLFGDPVTNPKGWPEVAFGSVCERVTVGIVVRPASYYRPQGVPALRSLNIKPGKIVLDQLVFFSEEDNETKLKKTRIRAGDLVLVRSGQPGTAAVVPLHLHGVNAIDLLIASPAKKRCDPYFACAFFNSRAGRVIILASQRGQMQQHLNVGSLSKAVIPLPPIELQREYSRRLTAVSHQAALQIQALAELDSLFRSLQYRAFRGELGSGTLCSDRA
jgi:type I restriction enzyme S subunit